MSEIRKPMVLVFAGPNGSGKSTITEWFNVVGKYTNADDMVRTSFLSNEEATKRADDLRYESIRKREDFTFETVLSSDYKIRILKKDSKRSRVFHQMRLCTDYKCKS